VVGQAAVFDGSSGIELPNNLIDDNAYSFSLWLNPSTLTAYTPSFFGYADADSWISLLPGGFGGDAIFWSGTNWYDGVTGVSLATGTWTHLAATVDNGEVRVYINGELVHSGSGFPDVFPAAENSIFALGINYWDTPYQGMMDEVKVYAELLTAAEVSEVYEAELLGEQ
jgi:arabinan endo-1,5-alpha-L-arabinosidase